MRQPRRAGLFALLGFAAAGAALRAQEIETTAVAPPVTGLQIRSVSVFFNYYSRALPSIIEPRAPLDSDGAGGGSVQIDWLKLGERSSAYLSYTSSVIAHTRYSEWNSWNHAASMSIGRNLSERWRWNLSGFANVSSIDDALFLPTTFGGAASVPATFDDLASAMLASKFDNPRLDAALNGPAAAGSPLRNVLFGERMLTLGARSALTYAISPRLALSLETDFNRNQHVSGPPQEARSSYLIPDSTSGSGGLSLSYEFSANTSAGAVVTFGRISSIFQDSYTVSSLATLGRKIARQWVVSARGGVGLVHSLREGAGRLERNAYPVGGVSLAFKARSHTLLGSADRTVGDVYGTAATTTSSAAFTWRWKQPGRAWWIESGASWQRLSRSDIGDTAGFRATAGVGRALGEHFSLWTEFAYQRYSNDLSYMIYTQDQTGVRVSLMWSPRPEIR